MKRLSLNVGFITNSSSVIYWFPKEILQDSEVVAFLNAYNLFQDDIGGSLWSRSSCATFSCTDEGWQEVHEELCVPDPDEEYPFVVTPREGEGPPLGPPGSVLILYGDEYQEKPSVFRILGVLKEASERLGLKGGFTDYN
jgi:hypothetical protein